jgi:hypothetical protein
MSIALLEVSVREGKVEAVLKEVAVLEPAERQEVAEAIAGIMEKSVQDLEELWKNLGRTLEGGVSPSDAAIVGRILLRSANLLSSSLELLASDGSPSAKAFSDVRLARLLPIKAGARSLLRIAGMPLPPPDVERMRRSLEQMGRGEGVDAADLLADLRG